MWGRICAQVFTSKGWKRAGVRGVATAANGLHTPATKALEGVGEIAKRFKAFDLLPIAGESRVNKAGALAVLVGCQ